MRAIALARVGERLLGMAGQGVGRMSPDVMSPGGESDICGWGREDMGMSEKCPIFGKGDRTFFGRWCGGEA